MTTFLSIDWDFFAAHPPDTDRTTLPEGGSVLNAMIYDWGAGETGAIATLEPYLWYSRAGHFRALGLDLREEFGIRLDLGSTRPADFVAEITRLAGGSITAPVVWADSHQWAYMMLKQVAEESDEPLTVLHFDAHHDLGYRAKQVTHMRKGNVDCGCWLLAALLHGLAEKAHVVYPDWRGLEEWEGSQDLPWMPKPSLAQAWTWSSYLERFGEEVTEVDGIFVARSGGWSPPYLDEEFSDMVEVLGHESAVEVKQLGPEIEMVREWSEERVQEEADIRLEMAAVAQGRIPRPARVGTVAKGGEVSA